MKRRSFFALFGAAPAAAAPRSSKYIPKCPVCGCMTRIIGTPVMASDDLELLDELSNCWDCICLRCGVRFVRNKYLPPPHQPQ